MDIWEDRRVEIGHDTAENLAKHYNRSNWRDHPDLQKVATGESLDTLGWVDQPKINLETGNLFDGHLRVELALLKNRQAKIPVDYYRLTQEEEDFALLVLDQTTTLATANQDKLDELIGRTKELMVDNPKLSVMLSDLRGKIDNDRKGEDTEPQIDKAEELQVKWGVNVGDLWGCGDHRLICGDCTDRVVVNRVIGMEKADAVVTDPPYGIGVDYIDFSDTEIKVINLINQFLPIILDMDIPIALTPGIPSMWLYPRPSWLMVWVHPAPVGSCPWGFAGVNPILVYGNDPYLKNGKGRRPDSITMATDRQGVTGHPTPKPIRVWEWLVERLTILPGNLVYDPFLGSGTTLIACENLTRQCRAIEISPAYVGVALQRFLDHTNTQPELIERVES